MNKSEQINELASALAKAQADIKPASKNVENTFFKSSYADLASVWDACRVALTKNGLSVSQIVESDDGCILCIHTVLMHTSGQFVSGIFRVKPSKSDPQSMGSATTYARRYALSAIVGVAPEDDDGNRASGHTPLPDNPTPPTRETPKPNPAPAKSEFVVKVEKWMGVQPEDRASAWKSLKKAGGFTESGQLSTGEADLFKKFVEECMAAGDFSTAIKGASK